MTATLGQAADLRTRPAAAIAVACVALFTDMLVYGLAIPVLPLLPATVAAGPAATGVLFASYAAAMIVVTPIAGRLVDRSGPRRPMLIGLVGLAAATLLFAVGAPYWLLVLARVLQGVAAGMSWVAGLSMIAAVTPITTRGRSMGLAMSMVSLGVLAGPPLAGILVDAFGVRAPFLLAAAVALADGVARLVLVRDAGTVSDDPAGPLAVLRVPGSWAVVGTVLIGAGTIAAVEPVLPLHLSLEYGTGPLELGLLIAVAVLAGVVANPLVGALVGRVDTRILVTAGAATAALALLGVAVSQQSWQVWPPTALLGLSNALLLAPATTLIGEQGMSSHPPALGGAYALFNLAYAGGLLIGPLLSGTSTELVGFTTTLGVLAAAVAAAGLAVAVRLPAPRSAGSSRGHPEKTRSQTRSRRSTSRLRSSG